MTDHTEADAAMVRRVLDEIATYAGNRNSAMRKGGGKTPLTAKWVALQIADIAEAIAEDGLGDDTALLTDEQAMASRYRTFRSKEIPT